MDNVTIIQLGPLRKGLKLAKVVKWANRAQQSYFFRPGELVEFTGDPNAEESAYTFDSLANYLARRRDDDNPQLLVGVTDHVVDDKMFSAIAEDLSCIIVSTNDIEDVLKTDRTTDTGYVLFEIAAQLLTIEYRHLSRERFPPTKCAAPWHREGRDCIFYWDEEREYTGQKMLKPFLCPSCEHLLYKAGVAPSIKLAAMGIAKSGLQPIWAWFRRTIANRWVVAFGAIVIYEIIAKLWTFLSVWEIIVNLWTFLSAGPSRPE